MLHGYSSSPPKTQEDSPVDTWKLGQYKILYTMFFPVHTYLSESLIYKVGTVRD